MPEARRSGRILALWVGLSSVAVGMLAGGVAAAAGSGGCRVGAVEPSVRGDSVCVHLVRTLAERVGVSCAVATAVLLLTMVGLARLSSAGERKLEQ
jgi:hypothetical protein